MEWNNDKEGIGMEWTIKKELEGNDNEEEIGMKEKRREKWRKEIKEKEKRWRDQSCQKEI